MIIGRAEEPIRPGDLLELRVDPATGIGRVVKAQPAAEVRTAPKLDSRILAHGLTHLTNQHGVMSVYLTDDVGLLVPATTFGVNTARDAEKDTPYVVIKR